MLSPVKLQELLGGDLKRRMPEVEIVGELHGSISAEHGIGQLKRSLLPQFKDPVELAMMRKIKATLDPNGILNPGKVL